MFPMLSITNLYAGYGGTDILRGINLQVDRSGVTVLLGSNGAGKTTLMMAISGLVRISSGDIRFKGLRIQGRKPSIIIRTGIAHVPEGRHVFPELTVEENLAIGSLYRYDRNQIKTEIERVLNIFPVLRERYRVFGGLLSGGEQQMLAIARALVGHPELLLIDEPTLGLAPSVADDVYEVLREIASQGTSLLLVEQSIDRALEIATNIYVMENGKIMLNESPGRLAERSQLADIYIGAAK